MLILRLWTEGPADAPRMRIVTVDEVAGGREHHCTAASVDEAVGAVRAWLEGWVACASSR